MNSRPIKRGHKNLKEVDATFERVYENHIENNSQIEALRKFTRGICADLDQRIADLERKPKGFLTHDGSKIKFEPIPNYDKVISSHEYKGNDWWLSNALIQVTIGFLCGLAFISIMVGIWTLGKMILTVLG